MICLLSGLPGSGKSQKLAKIIVGVLYRNKAWQKKSGITRKIYSNLKLAPEVEAEFPGLISYWTDPSELIGYRDVDVFWDEVATHLDSTQWQNMSLEIKRWLQQHRKFGIEIYGTTQDFAMIDKSMRRMTSDLLHMSKLFGSQDKSATKPNIKYIWGVCMIQSFDPTTYEEDNKKPLGLPHFMLISRKSINLYDTTQEIKMGKYPPLNHIERECIQPNCGFHKVLHA